MTEKPRRKDAWSLKVTVPEKVTTIENQKIVAKGGWNRVYLYVLAVQGFKKSQLEVVNIKPYHYSWHTQSPSTDTIPYQIIEKSLARYTEQVSKASNKLPHGSAQMTETIQALEAPRRAYDYQHQPKGDDNDKVSPNTRRSGGFRHRLERKIIPAQRTLRVWSTSDQKKETLHSKNRVTTPKAENCTHLPSIKSITESPSTTRRYSDETGVESPFNRIGLESAMPMSTKTLELMQRSSALTQKMRSNRQALDVLLNTKGKLRHTSSMP